MAKYKIGDSVTLTDDCSGFHGQIGKIVAVKSTPPAFGVSVVYDVKFESGYVLPDCTSGDLCTQEEFDKRRGVQPVYPITTTVAPAAQNGCGIKCSKCGNVITLQGAEDTPQIIKG